MMPRTAALTMGTSKRASTSFRRATPSCAAPTWARRSPRKVGVRLLTAIMYSTSRRLTLVLLVENVRGGREAHVRRHLVADGLEGAEDDLGGDGVGGGGAPGAGEARPRSGLARARAEGAQGLRARGEGHGVWLHRS